MILNHSDNSLIIKKKKKQNLLNLNNYTVKNLGFFKKKWSIALETQVPGRKKPSRIIIGGDNKEILEKWAGYLKNNQQVIIS